MGEGFLNVYEDEKRADSYARLTFPGTYYLAYRDLPALFSRYASGRRALDFGCGTGRSTRFLTTHGFEALGADIAAHMVDRARELDPGGDYCLTCGDDLGQPVSGPFDLILSVFTFDNIPGMDRKVRIFSALGRLLTARGVIISVVSSPEIYVHEWASFSTKEYPENRRARSGDSVRIVMLDVDDRRPVEDIVWSGQDYEEAYRRSDLEVLEVLRPLADGSEPYEWVSETSVAPWVIYVLAASKAARRGHGAEGAS
jgi:SAM-dependent methyltransferase